MRNVKVVISEKKLKKMGEKKPTKKSGKKNFAKGTHKQREHYQIWTGSLSEEQAGREGGAEGVSCMSAVCKLHK